MKSINENNLIFERYVRSLLNEDDPYNFEDGSINLTADEKDMIYHALECYKAHGNVEDESEVSALMEKIRPNKPDSPESDAWESQDSMNFEM